MVIGTYSATEDTVTLLFNQVYGAYVHSFANLPTGTGLDTASWYSVARVLDTLKTQLTLQGKDSSQIDSILNPIETSLNAFLIPHFFSYIFNGDTLTLSGTSFIKQQ